MGIKLVLSRKTQILIENKLSFSNLRIKFFDRKIQFFDQAPLPTLIERSTVNSDV